MTASDAYGKRLGERLRVASAPVIVTRVLRKADIAVTEIRCDNPLPGMTTPVQREDAFLVGLSLRDFPHREYWEDGRQAPVCDVRAGDTCIHDLKRDPVVLLDKPYHVLFFYLPRAALNAIADDASAPRIGDLDCRLAAGVNDATIAGLGGTILPALSRPQQANRLFVDHVSLAVGIHAAQTYGGMRRGVAPGAGRARAVAGAPRQGNSQRQPRRQCAAQGRGAGVPFVGEPFLARIPPHRGGGAAPLAGDASHRSRQGEVAQYPIVAVGCGVGLRLRRSKSPDPGLHRNGRRQSRRLASRPRRTSSRRSATQPIKRSLVTHLLSNCLGAFNARPIFGPYALFHSCHDRKIQDRFFKK